MKPFELPLGQKVTVTIKLNADVKPEAEIKAEGEDKEKKLAPPPPPRVDGLPAWDSTEPHIASVRAADDGLSAVVTSHDLGNTRIRCRGHADLGSGVRAFDRALAVEVVELPDTGVCLEPGQPVDPKVEAEVEARKKVEVEVEAEAHRIEELRAEEPKLLVK